MSDRPIDDSSEEYWHIRALVEEHNANIFVETYVVEQSTGIKMLWIRFNPDESTPEKIIYQVAKIGKEFSLDLIVFAVGRSNYVSYMVEENQFYKIKSLDLLIPEFEIVERLRIPIYQVRSKIKCLFLEDKRRKLINENNKIS